MKDEKKVFDYVGGGRRRSSIAQELEAYKEAVKMVKPNELVVGFKDGAAITVIPHKLLKIIESMLNVSNMIYALATLRKIAKKYEEEKPGWFFGLFGKKEKIELKHKELILTDADHIYTKQDDPSEKVRYLKRDIFAADVVKFVDSNLDVFDKSPDAINAKEHDVWDLFKAEDAVKGKNAFLAEFDDQFASKECVYAITVNRDEKRVTIVFRGSVTSKDWFTDFKISLTDLDTPRRLKEEGFDKTIKVHRGFKKYLFDETSAGDEKRSRQKYDDIMDDLKRIYEQKEYKDYELFVTGHSLGGALCTLLGFKLAGTNRYPFLPHRVTVISFAAPKVGDIVFHEAFLVLEKKGFLRLIRVSNEGDLVPVSPPSIWPFGFSQTGVNVHLKPDDDMEVTYHNLESFYNLKSFGSQFSVSAAANHSLKVYSSHLASRKENIKFLQENSIEDLYTKKAGEFS